MDRWKQDWYQEGPLSRQQAEQMLKEHGFAEGLFLVRQSSTASGDFVISVVHDNEVIHYQVRKRGEDALFSLSEETKVIHGLDELVHYYKHNLNSGLQHRLHDHVPGQECPVQVKLHGTENLLHRATIQGDYQVVYQLIENGYRNTAAKNRDGQSALHLAAFYGHQDIVALLIRHGAGVNVADLSGYTPLHVAMHGDQPESARMLLDAGKANPTVRNQITGWVPLHEAAYKGQVS